MQQPCLSIETKFSLNDDDDNDDGGGAYSGPEACSGEDTRYMYRFWRGNSMETSDMENRGGGLPY